MYKTNTINKLEKALAQLHMLERVNENHVQANAQQVTATLQRLRSFIEDSKRLVELSK